MDTKEKVLATMKEAGQPLNAGKIAESRGRNRLSCSLQMGTCRIIFYGWYCSLEKQAAEPSIPI